MLLESGQNRKRNDLVNSVKETITIALTVSMHPLKHRDDGAEDDCNEMIMILVTMHSVLKL